MGKFVLLKDVIIPRGSVFDTTSDQKWWNSYVETLVEMGKDATWYFILHKGSIEDMPTDLITTLK